MYEQHFKKTMAPKMNEIESKIRLKSYSVPQDLLDDINDLKIEFHNQTERSDFKNRELILS
jgi:hypothetical protein